MRPHWRHLPPIAAITLAWVILIALPSLAGERPDGEALARQSGCLDCHSVDEKVTGPAYREVAARYRGEEGAKKALVEKVKLGGKGNWTEVTKGVPMPPHSPRLSDEEIEILVDWVLGLGEEVER